MPDDPTPPIAATPPWDEAPAPTSNAPPCHDIGQQHADPAMQRAMFSRTDKIISLLPDDVPVPVSVHLAEKPLTLLDPDEALHAPALPTPTTRTENGRVIYSVGGVDLISRNPANPATYTVLRDFPRWAYKVGDVKHLSEPHDESLRDTLRDLVASLES